jgi:DEAD/DEAH box helicase domain-containing protein
LRSTESILRAKGYNYYVWETPGEEPEYADTRFTDILPETGRLEIGSMRLYRHQYEAYRALSDGYNVILRSGTGSGKTESWILYALRKAKEGKFHALAVYPTIALANDQIRRIKAYSSLLNMGSLQLDAKRRSEITSQQGVRALREKIASSTIIATNPAYLMHEVKKAATSPSKSLLHPYLQNLDLLVIDELDFYGPRSIALLLGITKILSMITERQLQVAVLTAALSNPDDLGVYLQQVTGRKYRVINGRPFHVRNKTVVVLGKNLEKIWEKITPIIRKEASRLQDRELMEIAENPGKHMGEIYRVLGMLEAMGYDVPAPTFDPTEILSEYIGEDGVTLVFTRSIAAAEELARKLKAIVGEERVATHHHLVSKKRREEVEEKARRGEINIIVNPKTLSQGIDIGSIIRIVHLGLPEDVREYVQREGRKGRRKGIESTETVIIPYTRWDHELLMRGPETFRKWLNMGIEKTIINSENLYLHLFTGILKLKSHWMNKRLEKLEEEALRKTGVITRNGVDEKLLDKIYMNLNFYEYAPPYGIKRYLVDNRGERPLEPIGHCDLVEKFQPGCIDYAENALVTMLKTGRSTRLVTAVYEQPMTYRLFTLDDTLQTVLEEYRYIKASWGDEPNIIKDLYH